MAMERQFMLRDTHSRTITALGYHPLRRDIFVGYEGLEILTIGLVYSNESVFLMCLPNFGSIVLVYFYYQFSMSGCHFQMAT